MFIQKFDIFKCTIVCTVYTLRKIYIKIILFYLFYSIVKFGIYYKILSIIVYRLGLVAARGGCPSCLSGIYGTAEHNTCPVSLTILIIIVYTSIRTLKRI